MALRQAARARNCLGRLRPTRRGVRARQHRFASPPACTQLPPRSRVGSRGGSVVRGLAPRPNQPRLPSPAPATRSCSRVVRAADEGSGAARRARGAPRSSIQCAYPSKAMAAARDRRPGRAQFCRSPSGCLCWSPTALSASGEQSRVPPAALPPARRAASTRLPDPPRSVAVPDAIDRIGGSCATPLAECGRRKRAAAVAAIAGSPPPANDRRARSGRPRRTDSLPRASARLPPTV